MNKRDIRDLSYEELTAHLKSVGEASFHAKQIFEWIYQKGVTSFDEMNNLSKDLRAQLSQCFTMTNIAETSRRDVSTDGTTKFLFELDDGENIETVLIPTPKRATVCVSTQVGCKFGCRFCASGIGGWKRNLSTAEILEQVLWAKKYVETGQCPAPKITNIVFMGVGEPLDNYDNLVKAIRVINSPKGLNVAARRITISTCGLVPGIKKLATEGLQIELAVSLHGSNNEARNALMPVNKKYPMDDLIDACREYSKVTKRQITFEYILIKDVTCTEKAAKELGRLLKGLLCKINLIPYNPVSEFDYEPPSRNKMFAFKDYLQNLGIHMTMRAPRGKDVSAACGQLRYAAK